MTTSVFILANVFLIVGLLFLGTGLYVGLSPSIDAIIDEEIVKKRQLKRDTEQFAMWEKWPHPRQFRIFVFNVTNPLAVIGEGAKPKVREVGPVVYQQFISKKKIRYFEKDDAFTYKQHVYMEFVKAESAYSEDQLVTVLNLLLLDSSGNVSSAAKKEKKDVELLWSKPFRSKRFFVTAPAKDFLFTRYRFCNPFVKLDPLRAKYHTPPTRRPCEHARLITLSPTAQSNGTAVTFSMFRYKSNSEDVFRASAGIDNFSTLGEIKSWNNRAKLNLWADPESPCNRVRGRESTFYPPFNNETSSFYVYDADFCRVFHYKYDGKTIFREINGIKITMTPENMRNDGENSCYCANGTRNLEGQLDCLPNGFCDMGRCFRSPVIISFPHMLWADERYRNTVEGLHPDESKHGTFASIEARTGIPLQMRKRIQFNMIIRPKDTIPITQKITPSILPLLWVEECFDLSDELVRKVHQQYTNKLYVLDALMYTLLGTGIISLFVAHMLFYYVIP